MLLDDSAEWWKVQRRRCTGMCNVCEVAWVEFVCCLWVVRIVGLMRLFRPLSCNNQTLVLELEYDIHSASRRVQVEPD